jgi:hypothetical protein
MYSRFRLKPQQVRPPHRAGVCRGKQARTLAIAICAFVFVTLDQAAGQQPSEDATQACGMAAARAERDWQLPTGLLAAVGIVESGRRAPTGVGPIIWPWTINAEGRGFYQPTKAAAVGMVRSLQLRGVKVIDVGCFQVDLFYHPYAFTSLEEAFDPDANARAAAGILSRGRLGSTGWDGAIAAYHSASPLLGVAYMRKVHAVWSWARSHPSWGQPDLPAAFAVLLSPQALLVKVVTPSDSFQTPSVGLPYVVSVGRDERLAQKEEAIQWLHPPEAKLPRVLTPSGAGIRFWSP